MFCKKCGKNIVGKKCNSCDSTMKRDGNRWPIILIALLFIGMHIWLLTSMQENTYIFTSLLGIIIFFAELLGSLLAFMSMAFIPAGILITIIYRKEARHHFKFFLLAWIIIAIVLTYFVIQNQNVEYNIKNEQINDNIGAINFNEDGFYIDFPSAPEIATFDTEKLTIKAYATTDGIANYYVKVGKFDENMTNSLKTDPNFVAYFMKTTIEKLVPSGATDVSVLASEPIIFFDEYAGMKYKNSSNIGGVEYYHKGIFFVRGDGATVQVSMNYPKVKDSEMIEKYNNFIKSLKLK